jgi:hypothetical protein
VTLPRPGREQQEQARVGDRTHLVTLARREAAEEAGAAAHGLASQARSWTWWSWSISPAGRAIVTARAS